MVNSTLLSLVCSESQKNMRSFRKFRKKTVRYITIYRDIIDQKNLVDLAEIEHTFESSNKFARGFSIRSSILVVE